MSDRGKSINVFLVDGNVDGLIKCTLANWTGVAYKIPRVDLERCKDREHLKQSGVYFLFGQSDQTGENVVYIGQAGIRKNGEGILNRLQEHKKNPDKDYWTEAVAFTTSNNSFGPTEISYLENRFYNMAVAAKRYVVKNGNDPTSGNITEEKESELEEFIDYAIIIMGTLGHKIFLPIDSETGNRKKETEPVLLFKNSKVNAKGKRSSDGFLVLKDSKISAKATKSCPPYIRNLRERYHELIRDDYVLQENLLFNSPSTAAAFVNYASTNGLTAWMTEDGKTLKYLEE